MRFRYASMNDARRKKKKGRYGNLPGIGARLDMESPAARGRKGGNLKLPCGVLLGRSRSSIWISNARPSREPPRWAGESARSRLFRIVGGAFCLRSSFVVCSVGDWVGVCAEMFLGIQSTCRYRLFVPFSDCELERGQRLAQPLFCFVYLR